MGELATPRWASDSSSMVSTHPHTSLANLPIYDPYATDDIAPSWGTSIFNDLKNPEDLTSSVRVPAAPRLPQRLMARFRRKQNLHEYPASAPLPPIPPFEPPPQRATRNTPRRRGSITEESGGEEILYKPPVPRVKVDQKHSLVMAEYHGFSSLPSSANATSSFTPAPEGRPVSFISIPSNPPSSFQSHPVPHKAKKRTSDEFERDQFGVLISKTTGLSLHGAAGSDKEDKGRVSGRHRSTGVGSPALKDRPRDRRRTDSTGMGVGNIGRSGRSASGHSHQGSTSSVETRRVFSSDFGQLTSQPSTSPVTSTRLRQSETATEDMSREGETLRRQQLPAHHSSPSVAHSLLRGTQEGWSGMDDTATAEALRKLDGIGRPLRGRSSFGSSRQNSRAGTPASRGGLAATGWEGRDIIPNGREQRDWDKDTYVNRDIAPVREPAGQATTFSLASQDTSDPSDDVLSHDEHLLPNPPFVSSKHSSKDFQAQAGSRSSSHILKRGSASSVSVTTGTPTTSSRDSISLSTTTSATSTSALSHRHSPGKLRRSSGGSDISSVNSEFIAQKDRVAALASGDAGDDSDTSRIPPVPPLPKAYQSPSTANFNVLPVSPRVATPLSSGPTDDDRTFTIPTIGYQPETPAKTPSRSHTQPSPKGPTKKWSFSNALNLKSPSKDKDHKSPNTPRKSKAMRQSTSSSQASESWSVIESPNKLQTHLHASPSISSLKPISDTSPTPTTTTKTRTPDCSTPSRTERTESSASTQTTSQALRSRTSPPVKSSAPPPKRLTPSNIPFFRRSSSSSMKASAFQNESPPLPPFIPHHTSSVSISTAASKSTNSLDIHSPTSPVPHGAPHASRKASVLSLLKGSSSRKSIGAGSEIRVEKEKELPTSEGHKEAKPKKEDKERSESRISILMGRKRGKVSCLVDHVFDTF